MVEEGPATAGRGDRQHRIGNRSSFLGFDSAFVPRLFNKRASTQKVEGRGGCSHAALACRVKPAAVDKKMVSYEWRDLLRQVTIPSTINRGVSSRGCVVEAYCALHNLNFEDHVDLRIQ